MPESASKGTCWGAWDKLLIGELARELMYSVRSNYLAVLRSFWILRKRIFRAEQPRGNDVAANYVMSDMAAP